MMICENGEKRLKIHAQELILQYTAASLSTTFSGPLGSKLTLNLGQKAIQAASDTTQRTSQFIQLLVTSYNSCAITKTQYESAVSKLNPMALDAKEFVKEVHEFEKAQEKNATTEVTRQVAVALNKYAGHRDDAENRFEVTVDRFQAVLNRMNDQLVQMTGLLNNMKRVDLSQGTGTARAGNPATPEAPGPAVTAEKVSLLRNGGFEQGFEFWGTGYVETGYGNSMPPFWASWKEVEGGWIKTADVKALLDSGVKRSGRYSLKIESNIKIEPHMYGTISQRVSGLSSNTEYIGKFWVKAERASKRTLMLTSDLAWLNRATIPEGTYDWREVTFPFRTGNDPYVDYRLLCDDAGVVWVDDLSLNRVVK